MPVLLRGTGPGPLRHDPVRELAPCHGGHEAQVPALGHADLGIPCRKDPALARVLPAYAGPDRDRRRCPRSTPSDTVNVTDSEHTPSPTTTFYTHIASELGTGRPNAPSSGRISTGSGWPWAALILGRVAGQPLRWVRTTRQTCPASATSGRYWTCHVTQLRWPAFSATVAARLRRRCAAGRFGVGSVASRLAALSSRELRSDLGRRAGTSPAYC